jgi:hypothetical protein
MEITNDSPSEYQSFALRRFFWQQLGLRYDDLSFKEVSETLAFMELERLHPHRQKKTNGS